LRSAVTILVLAAVLVFCASAAFATNGVSIVSQRVPGWIAGIQRQNTHGFPYYHFHQTRSQWFLTRETPAGVRPAIPANAAPVSVEPSRPEPGQRVYANAVNEYRPRNSHFRQRDDFAAQTHYRLVGPTGSPSAVPEPSSFLGLAASAVGCLLYVRRRRSA